MKKTTDTTRQTQRLDPQSQAFVNDMRERARAGAGTALDAPGNFFLGPDTRSITDQLMPFMNPYIQHVIGGLGGQYDAARSRAVIDANQRATAAGAFGGSRAAVERGARLGELDVGQLGQTGSLLAGGFNQALDRGLAHSEYVRALRERQAQEPLWRQQQAQQMLNLGLGPVGQTSTTSRTQQGSTAGALAGLAGTALGAYLNAKTGGVAGAVAGGLKNFGSGFQFTPSPEGYYGPLSFTQPYQPGGATAIGGGFTPWQPPSFVPPGGWSPLAGYGSR